MPQGKRKWPKVRAKHKILEEHGTLILAEIHQLLEHAQTDREGENHTAKDIPSKAYKPLFDSVLAFIHGATQADQNKRDTYEMIKDIHANVAIIKIQSKGHTDLTNTKMASKTLSWGKSSGYGPHNRHQGTVEEVVSRHDNTRVVGRGQAEDSWQDKPDTPAS